MTLPVYSGNMSQLYCRYNRGFKRGFYCGVSWISLMAKLAGATIVASISQFDPFAKHFASP
ncbi:MAG: hypothetical protein WD448_03520 [Woeseia sp.]